MAKTHTNFQDVKVTNGLTALANVNVWVNVPSQLATRTEIQLLNTGVSEDSATAHSLDVRFYQGATPLIGTPTFRLFAGDSWSGNLAPEVNIGVRSSVVNGTFTLIEAEDTKYREQNAPYNR